LAAADSPFAHTAGTVDYIAAVHTVAGKAAAGKAGFAVAQTAGNMAATVGTVLFVHRLSAVQECLLRWGCHIPRRTLHQGYSAARSSYKMRVLVLL